MRLLSPTPIRALLRPASLGRGPASDPGRSGLIALCAALVMVVAACGDGGSAGSPVARRDRTTVATTTRPPFTGDLADLPRPDGSRPVGDGSARGRYATQSYEVDGMTPEAILDFFAEALPERGWTEAEAPRRNGTAAFEGGWVQADHHLRVTAVEAGGLGDADGSTPPTQFSLELRPVASGDGGSGTASTGSG